MIQSTASLPTFSAMSSLTSICHSSWMLATNLASKVFKLIKASNMASPRFITIAPPPCNKVLRAACCVRIKSLRPSIPFNQCFPDALCTLSLRVLNDGLLLRNCSLSLLPLSLFPPTTLPSFASPAPYISA